MKRKRDSDGSLTSQLHHRLAAGGAGAAVLAACGPGQGTGPGEGAPEVKFGEPVGVTFWHTQTGVNERR